ncbi:MAG: hypothetical protein AAF281_12925 [Pseudomonadota bacterium]
MAHTYLYILQEFGDRVVEGDFETASSSHEFPVQIVRSEGIQILHTKAELAADLASFWPAYRQAGIRAVRPRILYTISHEARVALVDVEWSLFTDRGGLFCTLYTTYGFVNRSVGPRIVSVFSHNEGLERPVATV